MSLPPLGPGTPTRSSPSTGRAWRSARTSTVRSASSEGLEQRLAGVCGKVTGDDDARVGAGRDWWPLTVSWQVAGEVPSIPGLVATPADTEQVAAVVACCNDAGVPVVAMAGRSGVCGGSVPFLRG